MVGCRETLGLTTEVCWVDAESISSGLLLVPGVSDSPAQCGGGPGALVWGGAGLAAEDERRRPGVLHVVPAFPQRHLPGMAPGNRSVTSISRPAANQQGQPCVVPIFVLALHFLCHHLSFSMITLCMMHCIAP
jgi:hypothetical protein